MENPWLDTTLAMTFLRGLTGDVPDTALFNDLRSFDVQVLARWLTDFQLAAVTCREYGDKWPELADALTEERFTILAQNSMHFESIGSVIDAFNQAELPITILKGCSLAEEAWGGVEMRPMSDADLWISSEQMPRAVQILHTLGYEEKAHDLPLEQHGIVESVLEFARPGWDYGQLDVHWLPLHGWWSRYCASFDFDAMWARRVPVEVGGRPTHRLSNEDQLIHLATHATVNAHVGKHAGIRGMLDIILSARVRPVDWDVVVARATEYRVKTAVWFILDLAHQFFSWDEIAPVLKQLAPSKFRQTCLKRLINVESILSGRDISPTKWRYALILGLVDRPRDILNFFYRSIIPEKAWQAAKYGRDVRPWHHILQIILKR